jgi:hypothetical protein
VITRRRADCDLPLVSSGAIVASGTVRVTGLVEVALIGIAPEARLPAAASKAQVLTEYGDGNGLPGPVVVPSRSHFPGCSFYCALFSLGPLGPLG